MKLTDFDYPLPKDLIAQEPLQNRDTSRLLIADRKNQKLYDRLFLNITDYFNPGDVLVLNDTKVFKSRVLGKKKVTGGKVDLLFLGLESGKIWRCLIQPSMKEGQEIELPEGVSGIYTGRNKDGLALIELLNTERPEEWLEKNGTMPLPPYIKREPKDSDINAYQTVYAKEAGAVAAPTAGLHFTQKLFEQLKAKGVQIVFVTLHVGYGTFKPVDDLENHVMHSESFTLSEETAQSINDAKQKGHKIWAVGTTSLRVLETCVVKKRLVAGKGQTNLYIKEPFPFEIVDALITNFHLPKTTLLLLVSAFMGENFRKKAYERAIEQRYRFYSYGDAMLII